MTRKDYEAAARIVQNVSSEESERELVADAFVELFEADSSSFDEMRFRRACVPFANVRARG